jgi:uncharacterized membrane protein
MPSRPAPQTLAAPAITEPVVAASATTRRWRILAVSTLLALIVLGLAWELWLAPLPGGSGALALKVLPLSLALAGLLKHKLYTYRWVSLLVWLYLAEGSLRLMGEGPVVSRLAALELLLGLLLFSACVLYVRSRIGPRGSRRSSGMQSGALTDAPAPPSSSAA